MLRTTFRYVNLLNITIRFLHKDSVTALPYAQQEMFAFVFYWRIDIANGDAELATIHKKLVAMTVRRVHTRAQSLL